MYFPAHKYFRRVADNLGTAVDTFSLCDEWGEKRYAEQGIRGNIVLTTENS